MFLDQDQMYLRMCNVNKEKISLENTWRCSFIGLDVFSSIYLFIYLLFETIVYAQFFNYIYSKIVKKMLI